MKYLLLLCFLGFVLNGCFRINNSVETDITREDGRVFEVGMMGDDEPIGGEEPMGDDEPIGGEEPTTGEEPMGGEEAMGGDELMGGALVHKSIE